MLIPLRPWLRQTGLQPHVQVPPMILPDVPGVRIAARLERPLPGQVKTTLTLAAPACPHLLHGLLGIIDGLRSIQRKAVPDTPSRVS